MVLGLRSKSRRSVAIQVDYLIHVEQIKPWSSSSRSAQCLSVQWENDDSSGSFSCTAEDGKVEIRESFKLTVTLCKEASKKKSNNESFQKNSLEFALYESLKNNAVKGQLLGSAEINLADYGIVRETVTASIPVSGKKGLKNLAQPVLYITIQPCGENGSNFSSNSGCLKETYLEKAGSGSSFAQGNDEDVEIASFTDDDIDHAVHSSFPPIASTTVENSVNSLHQNKKEKRDTDREDALVLEVETSCQEKHFVAERIQRKATFYPPSANLPDRRTSAPGLQDRHKLLKKENTSLQEAIAHESHEAIRDAGDGFREEIREESNNSVTKIFPNASACNVSYSEGDTDIELVRSTSDDHTKSGLTEKDESDEVESDLFKQTHKKKKHFRDVASGFLKQDTRKQAYHWKGTADERVDSVESRDPKNEKTAYRSSDSSEYIKLLSGVGAKEVKEVDLQRDDHKSAVSFATDDKQKVANSSANEAKLENKIAMLEEELREAAAIEVSLYSVVAEHASSSNKVHSPARRLSRFYFHACKANSPAKRASAARAVVNGLILVSKACGNDVPRLTFWLSNAITLRAIITLAASKLLLVGEECGGNDGSGETSYGYSAQKVNKRNLSEYSDVWENPLALTIALERVETWIFSRIVESVWWQTMTPHMQPSAAKSSNSRKIHGRKHALCDQEQGKFSTELWRKAFKDAGERLCPIRTGGHECGCLPVLARLVMEQLIGRLDVAMLNAILRGSVDDMPTDPISDPISDAKVLPVPAGKSGFKAAVQLKNAIGDWSRWLSDLFDIDEDDSPGDGKEQDDDKKQEGCTPFKAFPLLNALSDLMKLPFDVLADGNTRKEVCPAFSSLVIKRVLENFVPDEYSPDPVPWTLLEALDSEDPLDCDKDTITNIPCVASPLVYTPVPASSLSTIIGEMGSLTLTRTGSSILRKAYTSDDELDELDSPISSIIHDGGRFAPASSLPNWMLKGQSGREVVRYQLLGEVWRDGK